MFGAFHDRAANPYHQGQLKEVMESEMHVPDFTKAERRDGVGRIKNDKVEVAVAETRPCSH
jgi:hypothetical protein